MIEIYNDYMEGYVHVEYELFTACNKRCSYCFNMDQNDFREIKSYDQIIKNLDIIMGQKNDKIILQLIGGEPLVHKKFNDIIKYIYDNKKPNMKVSTFTHADHEFDLFKRKIDSFLPFKDLGKINCSLHFEELNKERFEKNMRYLDENFKNVCVFILPCEEFRNNYQWFKNLITTTNNIKFTPLLYDKPKDEMSHLLQFKHFTIFDDISEKLDLSATVDGVNIDYHKAKTELYKKYQYNFRGKECTLKYFEVDKDGKIRLACNSDIVEELHKIDDGYFDNKCVTCEHDKCLENLLTLHLRN
jgi:organic radical activating enzyme